MNYILPDNDLKVIEILISEVKKIEPKALIDIHYFPCLVTIKIQSDYSERSTIFNKLRHVHNLYGIKFTPTQFIKRDKNLISFDLKRC